MASLRVCLLAPDFLPVWGGAGTYAVELTRELASRVDLTILTLERTRGEGPYTKERMEQLFEHRVRVEVISEARENFRYNAAFQMAVLRRLPSMVRQERFDIVHSQHAHMPDLLYRRFNHSPPIVRTVHSTIGHQRAGIWAAQQSGGKLEASENWQIALEPLLRMAEWITLRDTDQIVTVSHFMADELSRLGIPRQDIRVVYNGVRVDRFRPDASAAPTGMADLNGPIVLYSGRPTLLKGIGTLIDALPAILREVPSAHFAFAGGSEAEFRNLTQGRNLPMDHIHLLGKLRYDDLPGVYAAADVAVAPSFRDNVPFWVLEAMSSGLPVVASRVGGIPELVTDGKTGVLVPPGSSDALAKALIPLLQNRDRRKELGHAARNAVIERFNWARTATETVELYRATLNEAGSEASEVRSPAVAF
jgi:L-malate glycosyltransferase